MSKSRELTEDEPQQVPDCRGELPHDPETGGSCAAASGKLNCENLAMLYEDANRESEKNSAGLSPPCDIVCFSIIEWDFRFQRPQQIMAEFANQGHRVFYLSILKFLPVGERRFNIRPLRHNIVEVQLALPQIIDVYSGELSVDLARFIAESLRALRDEFNITRAVSVVQICTWAPVAYVARDTFGWPIIYDCMDDWNSFPGMENKEGLHAQERKLVRLADMVAVSGQKLWGKWSGENSNTVLARNATDFERFQKPQTTSLLTEEARPIIGYFGAIADWFDLELMERVAKERPAYTFVLIGEVFGIPIDTLEALPNVRLTGGQPYSLMPDYLHQFDVCLIPFKVNAVTEATDAVKFYEYISQGKPVVASAMPELFHYGELLYIASNPDDFIHKLDTAVQENDPVLRTQRVELARQNTWRHRVANFKSGIERAQLKHMLPELIKIAVALAEDLTGEGSSSPHEQESSVARRLALHLTASLAEREQAVQVLTNRLAELNHQIAERERVAQELANRLAERERVTQGLTDRLAVRDQTLSALEAENRSLQIVRDQLAQTQAEAEATVARLDQSEQSVASLQTLLDNQERKLAEKESRLQQITGSLGWRLLNLYGPIKYRYLLPIYRALGFKTHL